MPLKVLINNTFYSCALHKTQVNECQMSMLLFKHQISNKYLSKSDVCSLNMTLNDSAKILIGSYSTSSKYYNFYTVSFVKNIDPYSYHVLLNSISEYLSILNDLQSSTISFKIGSQNLFWLLARYLSYEFKLKLSSLHLL